MQLPSRVCSHLANVSTCCAHAGDLHVFAGIHDATSDGVGLADASFYNLRAPGAVLVSGSRENGVCLAPSQIHRVLGAPHSECVYPSGEKILAHVRVDSVPFKRSVVTVGLCIIDVCVPSLCVTRQLLRALQCMHATTVLHANERPHKRTINIIRDT